MNGRSLPCSRARPANVYMGCEQSEYRDRPARIRPCRLIINCTKGPRSHHRGEKNRRLSCLWDARQGRRACSEKSRHRRRVQSSVNRECNYQRGLILYARMPTLRDATLSVTATDKHLLISWMRAGLTPQRVVRRAQIVLLAADGASTYAVAQRLGISRHTAALWWRRYENIGPAGLWLDAPGRGRKPSIKPETVSRVRALVRYEPAGGWPLEHPAVGRGYWPQPRVRTIGSCGPRTYHKRITRDFSSPPTSGMTFAVFPAYRRHRVERSTSRRAAIAGPPVLQR